MLYFSFHSFRRVQCKTPPGDVGASVEIVISVSDPPVRPQKPYLISDRKVAPTRFSYHVSKDGLRIRLSFWARERDIIHAANLEKNNLTTVDFQVQSPFSVDTHGKAPISFHFMVAS